MGPVSVRCAVLRAARWGGRASGEPRLRAAARSAHHHARGDRVGGGAAPARMRLGPVTRAGLEVVVLFDPPAMSASIHFRSCYVNVFF